jgi:hypothetical protein
LLLDRGREGERGSSLMLMLHRFRSLSNDVTFYL